MRLSVRLLVSIALCVLAPAAQSSKDDCIVILMHGKWSNAQYISGFGRQLAPACDYESIEMPWSLRRSYDKAYPLAIQEIEEKVAEMRGKGFKKVLLGGHSFGANAAIAYMAERGDVDGILAVGSGHIPSTFYDRGATRDSVEKARQMITDGRGSDQAWFEDVNQGQRKSVQTSANSYLSYFDPEGLAHMPASTARFKRPVPFLWLIGAADRLQQAGPDFAFNKAPPHTKSRYEVVTADHSSVLDIGGTIAREWIKTLDLP